MKKNGMFQERLKRGLVCAGILMMALSVYQNPAQAKMIRGEVVAINNDGNSFSFKRSKPSDPAVPEQFDIVVLANTKFERILSLKELAAGDVVVVDAAQKKDSGTWEANTVRILNAKIY